MKKIDFKDMCKANGFEGGIAVCYDKEKEALASMSCGKIPLGLMAIEVLSIFFQQTIEQNVAELDDEKIAELGAMICTKAYMVAQERIEKDNE